MLIGINYPWIHYGWDFGDPPEAWVAGERLPTWREQNRRQIDADLRQFASQGILAVRWFLLGDGTNYGMGELAPSKAGNDWTFDPLPAGHLFYEQLCADFEYILQCCAKHGLKLFPSLIDFGWCRQGVAIEGSPGIIKGGRYDVIRDPIKRKAFFDRTLSPLLDISLSYRDSIYAWELINEPEWVVRKFWPFGRRDGNRTVRLGKMKAFIGEGIQRIHADPRGGRSGAFRSSIGFAHWDTPAKWNSKELGVTLNQFHYYAQNRCPLPAHLHSEDSPCILGEFATAAAPNWPDLKSLNKDQTLANRLACIEGKGYPACFLWSARGSDEATRWTASEHREITMYRGSDPSDHLA